MAGSGGGLRNGLCLTLWFVGMPPARILKLYETVASTGSARPPT